MPTWLPWRRMAPSAAASPSPAAMASAAWASRARLASAAMASACARGRRRLHAQDGPLFAGRRGARPPWRARAQRAGLPARHVPPWGPSRAAPPRGAGARGGRDGKGSPPVPARTAPGPAGGRGVRRGDGAGGGSRCARAREQTGLSSADGCARTFSGTFPCSHMRYLRTGVRRRQGARLAEPQVG